MRCLWLDVRISSQFSLTSLPSCCLGVFVEMSMILSNFRKSEPEEVDRKNIQQMLGLWLFSSTVFVPKTVSGIIMDQIAILYTTCM